jgi:hypothetical protein
MGGLVVTVRIRHILLALVVGLGAVTVSVANGPLPASAATCPSWPANTTYRYSTAYQGQPVKDIQASLNQVQGARLSADGYYGRGTETAVRSFQTANGLASDGIAGPATLAKLLQRLGCGSPPPPSTCPSGAMCLYAEYGALLHSDTGANGWPAAANDAAYSVFNNGNSSDLVIYQHGRSDQRFVNGWALCVPRGIRVYLRQVSPPAAAAASSHRWLPGGACTTAHPAGVSGVAKWLRREAAIPSMSSGMNPSAECAAGTVDVGTHDAYVNSTLVRTRMCRIPGFPSTGSTGISAANGEVVVGTQVSAQFIAMFNQAKSDGLTLRAISSFRSMALQTQLYNDCGTSKDPGCVPNTGVATPGKSPHQRGIAVDLSPGGDAATPGGCASGRQTNWNNASAGSTQWVWAEFNAVRFGIYQLPHEWWHWEANSTGNCGDGA